MFFFDNKLILTTSSLGVQYHDSTWYFITDILGKTQLSRDLLGIKLLEEIGQKKRISCCLNWIVFVNKRSTSQIVSVCYIHFDFVLVSMQENSNISSHSCSKVKVKPLWNSLSRIRWRAFSSGKNLFEIWSEIFQNVDNVS